MKSTRKSVVRLFPMLALIVLLPFANWSCEDAGDEPGGPTGAVSQYYPEMDTQGSGISVSAEGNFNPGGEFDLVVRFTDGDGRPVEGVPVVAQAEGGTGAVVSSFTFDTNPPLTNAAGRCSIPVRISADCTPGSYLFVVYSGPSTGGPTARGYARVKVAAGGDAAVTSVSIIAGPSTVTEGDTASYIASVTATAGCVPEVQFNFGAGLQADADGNFTEEFKWDTVGTFYVRAQARCGTSPWVESAPYQVVVSTL
jgi:hypothetical protein